jgi:hypothetical protein
MAMGYTDRLHRQRMKRHGDVYCALRTLIVSRTGLTAAAITRFSKFSNALDIKAHHLSGIKHVRIIERRVDDHVQNSEHL